MMSSSLDQLVNMGFDKRLAIITLEEYRGDVQRACLALIGGDSGANQHQQQVVQASISQYDIESGRSACTCICLEASLSLLERLRSGEWRRTPDDIANIVTIGAITYEALVAGGTMTAEHTSVAEVLGAVARYRDVLCPATVRGCHQGVLGSDTFQRLFQAIRGERRHMSHHIAVAITKPPETVVAVLPPENDTNGEASAGNAMARREWLLFDSHPRPQLGLMGASIQRFAGEPALVAALDLVFPALDVESDNVMASMYNMVDCTPLVLK